MIETAISIQSEQVTDDFGEHKDGAIIVEVYTKKTSLRPSLLM